ncbi:MAG: hypothetical protein ACOX8C_11900 [Saccharomonospora viridis]|jgi:hypothetical protein|uniref:Uncharacterized protein n=1 Tax=Saccharomonospora viridis (strain ATCC 15386 / DSM 43017 / JCM 3036 / CCUG 5913 / NBRC 12207 / NCIMB 9602 / P101) TaxID=471857 RepID=C7MQC9_SACVD|nr:hypothetical protein [Saccharomonospora viridis]ACU96428.1 hypothetical protein Svir_13810 [Saccharomonospora viridis DSM 43017]
MGLLRRIFGQDVPDVVRQRLADGEHVLATAATGTGGYVAVTALGLWVPDEQGVRRIGWDVISKAVWQGDVLTVIEAEVVERAGEAQVLRDLPPIRHVLPKPGKIPYLVRQRVESSIRSRYRKELPGGGAWFVVRKLPGTDGSVLQVRPDPGTEPDVVRDIAREAAATFAASRAGS